jgi:hypothetical protein
MIPVIRHCPGCGRDRLFEQYHALAGSCPDDPGGDCPEWSCTCCGAALLIGFDRCLTEAAGALEFGDRVA